MKTVEITRQKAVGILKTTIRLMGNTAQRPTVSELYNDLRTYGTLLLMTGAKLIYDEGKFYISGYAQDGSDVDVFFESKIK